MTLDTKDGLNKFVDENLSDMINQLNDTYGPILFEELKNRMKFTIDEFNNEMSIVFAKLKKCEENRQKMYLKIKSADADDIGDSDKEEINKKNEDLSHWEKKIKEIESND